MLRVRLVEDGSDKEETNGTGQVNKTDLDCGNVEQLYSSNSSRGGSKTPKQLCAPCRCKQEEEEEEEQIMTHNSIQAQAGTY